jgi:hypothetical protein
LQSESIIVLSNLRIPQLSLSGFTTASAGAIAAAGVPATIVISPVAAAPLTATVATAAVTVRRVSRASGQEAQVIQ